jgi:hypothetical protein
MLLRMFCYVQKLALQPYQCIAKSDRMRESRCSLSLSLLYRSCNFSHPARIKRHFFSKNMFAYRLFPILRCPSNIRYLSGLNSKTAGNTFQKKYQAKALTKRTIPQTQVRTAVFSRSKNSNGGNGLLSRSTPAKKETSITFGRIAYAVKLVRLPFLLVAISTIGYQRGVTDGKGLRIIFEFDLIGLDCGYTCTVFMM